MLPGVPLVLAAWVPGDVLSAGSPSLEPTLAADSLVDQGCCPHGNRVLLSLGKSHPLGTLGIRAETYRTRVPRLQLL